MPDKELKKLIQRWFGNVLGSFVVMKLLEFVCPAILPIPFRAI